jgi:hypothetical protein
MPRVSESRYTTTIGWDDVPHLSERVKRELLADTPPHLRDARAKGIPSLGSGAIYPIPVSEVSVKPFAIPPYWPRAYGLDVGWNHTAAVWIAQDPTDQVRYIYAEYHRGEAIPSVHAAAIRARGEWVKGAIDPAARGRSQNEGGQLMAQYRDLGLKVIPANNAPEPGLYECWTDFSIGRMRVFSTLSRFWYEYRLYRRDEKGRVVKVDDHIMDAMRYCRMTWDSVASVKTPEGPTGPGFGVGDKLAGY